MVRYPIEDLVPGLILAEPVLSKSRKLLVAENTQLSTKIIDQLVERGYTSILIHVNGTDHVVPNETLPQALKQEFAELMEGVATDVNQRIEVGRQKESILDVLKSEKNNINRIIKDKQTFEMVDKILEELIAEPVSSVIVSKLQKYDSEFFEHIIRVVVTSLALGIKFGYNKFELTDLGRGALVYDIGMLAVPNEIIHKQGELTEEEAVVLRQHTLYGHMILSELPNFPATSTIIALAHHEHQDGTGYPRGAKGSNKPPEKEHEVKGEIHRYADIVRCADLYDMYLFGRKHYSLKLSPALAMKKMIAGVGKLVNSVVFKKLLTITALYPVGSKIRIIQSPIAGLDGYFGVVAKVDAQNMLAPNLILVEDNDKVSIKPILVDMNKFKGFQIELLS